MTPLPFRIGHGYDIHRLQPGGKLVLAGVTVATDLSPIAHSDGDVVLHALVDALLGAMGWGDIGEMFPNTDPRWKDAQSACSCARSTRKFSANRSASSMLTSPSWLKSRRLKDFKPQMLRSLNELLHAPVNVKAGTNEGCDAIGRGEAIAAHVVVLVAGDVTPVP